MSEKTQPGPERLSPRQDAVLKAAKEVAVKFIETGRMSVAAFTEQFGEIYQAVDQAVGREPVREPDK